MMRRANPKNWINGAILFLGALLLLSACDFGAARRAAESVGVIVELDSIETTISGQFVDAATGQLLENPVTLEFKGPDQNAPVDMYSDPISSQTATGGVTSFGLTNERTPTPNNPVKLHVVASADGFQTTSAIVEVQQEGSTFFRLEMLSKNPAHQPDEASGVRDHSGTVNQGRLTTELTVQTPDKDRGTAGIHLPSGSVLRTGSDSSEGNLTVDLNYYPPTDGTMDALPGNGAMETNTNAERFNVAGYMNLRIRDGNGRTISRITGSRGHKKPETTVSFPEDTDHPSTGRPLQAGDELILFQYDPNNGLWRSDTTITVETLQTTENPSSLSSGFSAGSDDLGIRWNAGGRSTSGWWAWGTQSQSSCDANAQVQIDHNGQEGDLKVVLQRSGLRYSGSSSLSTLTSENIPLSQLIAQSSVAQYQNYELVFTTRDGQTRTITNVDPCTGPYSVTLPEPTSVPRTDALFRAYPECPGEQKVRITSVPTVTIYYRKSNAPSGARWQTAGEENIHWVMDDPDNPTYIKWAELRLDGLRQDTRYDMYTTYDGQRYEASALVPDRTSATIEEDRVLVEYSQDFSSVCS